MFWLNSVLLSPSLLCLLPYFSAGLRAGSSGMKAAERGMGQRAQVIAATPSPSGVCVPVQVISTVPHLSLLLNLRHKCMHALYCLAALKKTPDTKRRPFERSKCSPLEHGNCYFVPHLGTDPKTLPTDSASSLFLFPSECQLVLLPSFPLLSSPVMDFLVSHTYATFQD